MKKEQIPITIEKAYEMGFTHFLRNSRDVIEPLEDFDEILEDSKQPHRGLPNCWLVDPDPTIPKFSVERLIDYFKEYHCDELPEVCNEQMEAFIDDNRTKFENLVYELNERIKQESIGFTYKPTVYVLVETPFNGN